MAAATLERSAKPGQAGPARARQEDSQEQSLAQRKADSKRRYAFRMRYEKGCGPVSEQFEGGRIGFEPGGVCETVADEGIRESDALPLPAGVVLSQPTHYPPGSIEKMAVMQHRYEAGLPMHVEGDCRDMGAAVLDDPEDDDDGDEEEYGFGD